MKNVLDRIANAIYHLFMDRKCNRPIVVSFILSKEEAEALDALLSPWGGKRGPYAKTLLLSELARKGMKIRKEEENERS